MMPPTEIKTVTVLRDTRGSFLRESNPNLVFFKPHCSFKNSKNSIKVHFDQTSQKTRPQSAHVYSHYESIKPPPQKKRPQSAKPHISISKSRPVSAASYKSTDSTDLSDIISELSKNLNEVVIVEEGPKTTIKKRVWRPKKKKDGIHYTPAPPPPIRAKWTTDRTASDVKPAQSKRRQNDLAWVRPYKYPTNFHSYDRFNQRRLNLLHRTGVPDFAKKFPVYGHSAAKQKCCYRPSKSVTHVDHHHRVGSVSLPHPARELKSPPPSPVHKQEPPQFQDQVLMLDDGGEEYIEDSDTNNNGSYAFRYEGDEERNYVYDGDEGEEDVDGGQGEDQTYDSEITGQVTEQYTEQTYENYREQNDDDLYFLSSHQKDESKDDDKHSEQSQEGRNLSGTFTKADFEAAKAGNDTESVKEEDTDGLYDIDDDDDGLYDDIPEVPSDIEGALERYKPKKTNRPQSAKYRNRTEDSESDAKEVDSDY